SWSSASGISHCSPMDGAAAPSPPKGIARSRASSSTGRSPVWQFAVGDCRIEQRIWMEPGAHTTYIGWRLLAAPASDVPHLSVALLVNGRDHHGETWAPGFAPEIAVADGALTARVQDRFALCIQAPGGAIAP